MPGLDTGLGHHEMQNKELGLIFTAVVLHTRLNVFTFGEDAVFVTGTHHVEVWLETLQVRLKCLGSQRQIEEKEDHQIWPRETSANSKGDRPPVEYLKPAAIA